MLSPDTLESYRQMTPAQRLRLTLDLSRSAWAAMLEGPAEVVSRRFERLRQQNDLRNARLCEAFQESQQRMESDSASSPVQRDESSPPMNTAIPDEYSVPR